MKRFLSFALVLAMMVSCLTINAFAAGSSLILDAEGNNGTLDEIITVTATISGTTVLKGARLMLVYNKNVVVPSKADGSTVYAGTESGKTANNALAVRHNNDVAEFDGDEYNCWKEVTTKTYTLNDTQDYIDYGIVCPGSDYQDASGDTDNDITDPWVLTKIRFKRIAAGDPGFTVREPATGTEGTWVADTGSNYHPTIVNNTANVITPDEFINDETATGGVKTITFAGRVGAEWMDLDYGVEFTTNKTGSRSQRYYGAKDGDTVALDAAAGTTQVFSFADWDGTFEIVLTNIAEAGDKEYKFFVGDNYTEAAIVVVE